MPPWNPVKSLCHPDIPHKAHGKCVKCYNADYKRTESARATHCEKQRVRDLKKKYGLTEADYDAMVEKQGGVCAICKQPQPSEGRVKRLAVDHCHATGRIRGLLCTSCNRAVGYLDNKDWIARATRYLSGTGRCTVPPTGWDCTREPGHDGPCAARRVL